MKLTIDIRMYRASGIGTYLRQLLPIIIEEKKDWTFFLLGDTKSFSDEKIIKNDNVRLIVCRAPIYSFAEQYELIKKIPVESDLYFSPHYIAPYFYRGKMVATIHDIFHISDQNQDKTWLKNSYARIMLKRVLNNAKIIMTDSEFTRQEMIKYNLPSIEKVRVVYIGLGIEREKFSDDKLGGPGKYLLYVGNVKPHKNLRRLIDAYKTLIEQNRINIPLKIVGESENFITGMPELREEILNSKWSSLINFTGWVDHETLIDYYRHATALVHPSLYEGFGLPPLEAMACGVPAIVSRAASLPEICGEAVLYCNPFDISDIADKISQIISERELRENLVKRGYQQIKKYNWKTTAESLYTIFEEAVNL
ncbi:MAG: glycosyltransferase family 1 protein [Candidatus Zixiibacteriota bacterium]